MKHVKPVSRVLAPAPSVTTLLEQAIIALISIYFSGWDNFATVVRNLQKFYSKT